MPWHATNGREVAGKGVRRARCRRPAPVHRGSQMWSACSARSAVGRQNGVIDKSRMETQAIKDARRFFAEVLTEMGLLAPFHDRPPAEIDRIIEACVDGFQDSMQRQAAARDPIDDAIPF